MPHKSSLLFTWLLLFLVQTQPLLAQGKAKGHAHNDYQHRKPLTKALQCGFVSIEADIFYHKDQFKVAHTRSGIRKNKTLEKLYLQPLQALFEQNSSWILPDSAVLDLVIDLKQQWDEHALRALEKHLLSYEHLFVRTKDGQVQQAPIRVFVSGRAVRNLVIQDNPRLFFIEGTINDIGQYPEVIVRVRGHFGTHFSKKKKHLQANTEKLQQLTAQAHQNKQEIRLYAIGRSKKRWDWLANNGIDYLNVDRLSKFPKWLSKTQ